MNAIVTVEDIKKIIEKHRVDSKNTFTDEELDKIEKVMVEGISGKDD